MSIERRPNWPAGLAIASLIVALASGTASANTLREALSSTYQANPTLTAQRENLKATDAGVAIARSAGRPTVTGTVGVNRDLIRGGRFDTGLSKGAVRRTTSIMTIRPNLKSNQAQGLAPAVEP